MDIERVWRTLRRVEVPGFDMDVVSSGLVRKVRVSRDGSRIAVYVDFLGSDPVCPFCKFVNHTLMGVVASKIRSSLRDLGFTEVLVVDASTGAEL